MTRPPKGVPEPVQLNLLDHTEPTDTAAPVPPTVQDGLSAQEQADAQVAWAEWSGDDIPFWTVAA